MQVVGQLACLVAAIREHDDALAFAELARDAYPTDSLERLSDVLVRELAYVFGGEHVHDSKRLALNLERLA